MKPTIRQQGDVSIVDLSGRITLGEGDVQLKEAVASLLRDGRTKIVLNMDKVTYMDSAGLGELVATHKRVVEKKGAMRILRPNTKVLDLFTMTKLIQLFDIYEAEAEAVSGF